MKLGLELSLGSSRPVGSASSLGALQAALSGSAESAIIDFTTATNPGTYSVSDLNGGTAFTQATAANQPGISGTLGAVMGNNDTVARATAGFTYSVILSMRKDAASTSGQIMNPTPTIYTDGNASAVAVWTVDGVTVSPQTRDGLYEALQASAGERICMAISVAIAVGTINFGATFNGMVGSIRRAVLIDQSLSDLAAKRTLALAWVAETT